MLEQFIEALEEGYGYDFICNHYWEMSNEDLKNIAKELLFALPDSKINDVVEELRDYV